MKTLNKTDEHTISNSPGYRRKRGVNSHVVFVTDDRGIHAAFEQIKIRLRGGHDNCLSLVYSITGPLSHILFKAELESLERRFLSQLLTYYVCNGSHASEYSGAGQQKLEIIINSNTCELLNFLVMGSEHHIQGAAESLRYLGIPSCQIQSQIF